MGYVLLLVTGGLVTKPVYGSSNCPINNWPNLSRPYTSQLLPPATRQHYCSCVLRMKYRMLHSTSCLRIDSPSISKRLVECTMWYYHVQHTWTIMLPCHGRQKFASCMVSFRYQTERHTPFHYYNTHVATSSCAHSYSYYHVNKWPCSILPRIPGQSRG